MIIHSKAKISLARAGSANNPGRSAFSGSGIDGGVGSVTSIVVGSLHVPIVSSVPRSSAIDLVCKKGSEVGGDRLMCKGQECDKAPGSPLVEGAPGLTWSQRCVLETESFLQWAHGLMAESRSLKNPEWWLNLPADVLEVKNLELSPTGGEVIQFCPGSRRRMSRLLIGNSSPTAQSMCLNQARRGFSRSTCKLCLIIKQKKWIGWSGDMCLLTLLEVGDQMLMCRGWSLKGY